MTNDEVTFLNSLDCMYERVLKEHLRIEFDDHQLCVRVLEAPEFKYWVCKETGPVLGRPGHYYMRLEKQLDLVEFPPPHRAPC